MTEKELIAKLNNLKSIKPTRAWMNNNRDLLLAQISNSGGEEKLSSWNSLLINLRSALGAVARPASALGAFILLLFAGSFSHQIFAQAKPNDSLYIARVISEKVKVNTVLDSRERDRLAARFASEHARDISALLAVIDSEDEANYDRVAKLSDSFNKEVDTVRSRMSRMSQSAPESAVVSVEPEAPEVFMAESSKSDNGIEIAISSIDVDSSVATVSMPAVSEAVVVSGVVSVGSAGISNISDSADISALEVSEEDKAGEEDEIVSIDTVKVSDSEKMLNEIKDLFDRQDYSSAAEKLQEVNKSIK